MNPCPLLWDAIPHRDRVFPGALSHYVLPYNFFNLLAKATDLHVTKHYSIQHKTFIITKQRAEEFIEMNNIP